MWLLQRAGAGKQQSHAPAGCRLCATCPGTCGVVRSVLTRRQVASGGRASALEMRRSCAAPRAASRYACLRSKEAEGEAARQRARVATAGGRLASKAGWHQIIVWSVLAQPLKQVTAQPLKQALTAQSPVAGQGRRSNGSTHLHFGFPADLWGIRPLRLLLLLLLAALRWLRTLLLPVLRSHGHACCLSCRGCQCCSRRRQRRQSTNMCACMCAFVGIIWTSIRTGRSLRT